MTKEIDSRRIKALAVSKGLLASLFSLDGTKRIKITGLPPDAKILDATGYFCDPRTGFQVEKDIVLFKVWSSEFPVIGPGDRPDDLELEVSEVNE